VIEPPPAAPPGGAAVEFEARVPPSGQLSRARADRGRPMPGRLRSGAQHRGPAPGRPPHARHRRRCSDRHLALPAARRSGGPAAPGARAAATPLPPAPLPTGSIRAHRRVHASGRIMVNRQPIKLGPPHAGKLVTVVIEDTHYRILYGEEELTIKPCRDTTPITRLYVRGEDTQPSSR
jgi:hypothetical protein